MQRRWVCRRGCATHYASTGTGVGRSRLALPVASTSWILLLAALRTGSGRLLGSGPPAGASPPPPANLTRALRLDRERAEDLWHHGRGLLWFQHLRRAGGTSLCHLLRAAVPHAQFLTTRGEACQPEDWRLRDAAAVCDHNLTLVALELQIQDGNAFAQEYGAIPGPELLGHRIRRRSVGDWVFVASMREPWARFWSQLRYEMATCLFNADHLARCIGGNFESLGHWWSPTAHPDSVLGVPGARLASDPTVYVDNYYTRMFLNRTDVGGPKLTWADFEEALMLLQDRSSTVVILEDFARSSLQLACAVGMDVGRARPLLRTHVRPYESHEAFLVVPDDEARLGLQNIKALRARFVQKNQFDYALYGHARMLAKRRLMECSRVNSEVDELRRKLPLEALEVKAPSPKPPGEGSPLPAEISVDDLFGCTGGSVDLSEDGQYKLNCPRTAAQHAKSWWSSMSDEGPKRKLGQALPNADCWKSGFTFAACCGRRFGPRGNAKCWDADFTHARCCRGA